MKVVGHESAQALGIGGSAMRSLRARRDELQVKRDFFKTEIPMPGLISVMFDDLF